MCVLHGLTKMTTQVYWSHSNTPVLHSITEDVRHTLAPLHENMFF